MSSDPQPGRAPVTGPTDAARAFADALAAPEPLVIGEVAQTHDGSLGGAHAFVDAIADAGADAVKFQTHLAHAESTPSEPWRVPFSRQDDSRYEYWQRMEFTESQWVGLRDHALERGLHFLSTPFSPEAVDLLERIDVAGWKVSSGEIANAALLARMAATGRAVVLSTGLSPWAEIDAAVGIVRAAGAPVAVLQCTTAYPTTAEQVGLNVLAELRARYGCPVGLSDHSATIYAGLAAVALGASVVEVHVTLSRRMFGPDVPASLTVEELAQLTEGARFVHVAATHAVDKDVEAERRADLRALFTKSLVARHDLAAGHVLTEADLVAKKPGTGIGPDRLSSVVGRTLVRAVATDTLVAWTDVGLDGPPDVSGEPDR